MRLFGANTSIQAIDFNYRVAEIGRSLRQLVPMGEQRMIGDDTLTPHQIQGIIENNERYAMVDIDKINSFSKDHTIVMVFSKDKPVPAGTIQDVLRRNRKELTKEGADRRAELAVVTANILGERNANAGQTLQMSIEEQGGSQLGKEDAGPLLEGHAGPESAAARVRGGGTGPGPGNPNNRRRGR